MNSPRKFLFDTTFESAAKSGAPNRVEAKPVVKTYTEEELNQAREKFTHDRQRRLDSLAALALNELGMCLA